MEIINFDPTNTRHVLYLSVPEEKYGTVTDNMYIIYIYIHARRVRT